MLIQIEDAFVITGFFFHIFQQAYSQTSNLIPIKSQNLNVSRLVLHLSLSNPLKPGVKSRMDM